MSTTSKKTLFMAQFALLLAILAVFCFTPLGSIPIGPIVATLALIPVIITAILMGPLAGTLMGFFAGLFSFIVWTFMTPPTSAYMAFVFTPFYTAGEIQGNFWSLVICFVPRILAGTFAGLAYKGIARATSPKNPLPYLVAGVLGSMTNTVLVLGGTYVFFGPQYAEAEGMLYSALPTVIGITISTNGVLEAAVSAVCAVFVCMPLRRALQKSGLVK